MKSVYVVRHAKSSWDLSVPNDFDRPLNDRGKADAPAAAQRLRKKGIKIDLFVSSPAKRAKKTAQHFIKAYDRDKDEIIFLEELYQAHYTTFFDVIRDLDDKYESVAIFSHNPGVTDFVNALTDTRVDNVPTSGVFAVQSEASSWREFKTAPRSFLFFDYPKLNQ